MIVIVMGVSGCGKSHGGKILSEKLNWDFEDADDHHPEANVKKMANGIPLDDEDRHPWLMVLHEIITKWKKENVNGILACSALKKSYRKTLTCGKIDSKDCNVTEASGNTLFIHLDASERVIQPRLEERTGHFMPALLLKSQFSTLQPPDEDENCITIDASRPVCEVVDSVLECQQIKTFYDNKRVNNLQI